VSRVAAVRAVLAAATVAVAGCASLIGGEMPQTTYHVWRDVGESTPAPKVLPSTLLVAPTATATFYDSQRIVFSREAGTRAHYQFAAWTDRPGRRFDVLLLERLDRRNAFVQVASTTAGVRGDLVLAVSVLDLYHDDVQPPGVARLRVTAELTDRASRALVARRTFLAEAPVAADNADAAVAALNTSLARLLDELVPWLEAEAGKAEPR
jgi:cholesterol transport system auxiliary component